MNDQKSSVDQNEVTNGQAPPQAQPGRPYDVHYHYYYEPPKYAKKKSSKPTVAGILLIIAAILGLIAGVAAVGIGGFIGDFENGFEMFGEDTNGDVYGTVTYLNGTGVENVTVSIEGEPFSTQTDNEGNYVIYNVPAGNHKIRVEKEGYNTIIYKAFISPTEFGSDESDDHDDDHGMRDKENEYDFTLTEGDEELNRGSYPPFEWIQSIMIFCGILIVIFSIIAMVGAIHALKRKSWKLALLGSILGLFTIFGTLFALIALFIIALSRDEFNGGSQEQP